MAEPTILVKKADGTTERVPLSSLTQKHGGSMPTKTTTPAMNTTQQQSDPAVTPQPSNISAIPPKTVPLDPVEHVISQSPQPIFPRNTVTPQTKVSSPAPLSQERTEPQSFELPSFFEPVDPSEIEEKKADMSDSDVDEEHELSTTTPVTDYFTDLAKAHEWNARDHQSPLEESLSQEEATQSAISTLPSQHSDDIADVSAALTFPIQKDLQRRFQALVQSRIKDVRSDAQLKEYAMKPVEHGGLNLTDVQAEELIEKVHTAVSSVSRHEDIPAPRKTVLKTSQTMMASDMDAPARMPQNPLSGGTLTDIHPPEEGAGPMGPIEEIGKLTLKDFRRYDRDPAKAVKILKDKVDFIREESYLEYQKVKHAWYESPLYQMYVSEIAGALRNTQALTESLQGELTATDIKEIAEFSATLRM